MQETQMDAAQLINSLRKRRCLTSPSIQEQQKLSELVKGLQVCNNDKAADFCLKQLQKNKINVEYQKRLKQVLIIEQIGVKQDNRMSARKIISESGRTYTYLRTENKLYIFGDCFVPIGPNREQVNVVISELNLSKLLGYLQLCSSIDRVVPLITVEKIWQKLEALIQIIWGNNAYLLYTGRYCRVLEEEKVTIFDQQNSSIIFKKNLWFTDNFDVVMQISGVKLLIEGDGIKGEEAIYTAWRKDVISESEYCRLIDKAEYTGMQWTTSSPAYIYQIKSYAFDDSASKARRYRNFLHSSLFLLLPTQIIEQIYCNGSLVDYLQNQIVYKELTALSKLYIIVEGEVSCSSGNEQLLGNGDYFGLSALLMQTEREKITLAVKSKEAFVFSIDLSILRFLLGHFMTVLRKIDSSKDMEESEEIYSCLSKFTRKTLIYDNETNRHCSQRITKRVGSNLRISLPLWQHLCYRDLRVLLATQNQALQNIES